MAQLYMQKNQQVICKEVVVAKSFWSRAKGLLGTRELPEGQCLWIQKCNSIHTWFMNYPIDVIFVDQNLKVIKTYKNFKPWKITAPNFKTKSVFEMQSGWLNDASWPQPGDQLYVDA